MKLVLVLGDQLTPALLAGADPARDVIVMAEVMTEATYVPHHPKKIALILSAMRKYARWLRGQGWQVAYTRLDDPETAGSIPGEILRRTAQFGTDRVQVTRCGEWRLRQALAGMPLHVTERPDPRLICSEAEFAAWAHGRKSLRMEHFYRDMRRKTGLLMEGDAPAGGQWNFDALNRKPAAMDLLCPGPLRHPPDAVVDEVLDLVEARFGGHFGDLRPFWFATDADQARAGLAHFVTHHLADFGPYQDAMLAGDAFVHHALVSTSLNIGLLDPLETCRTVEAAWRAGRVPIQSAEGFIRQILGWREYVRGIYDLGGPEYSAQNALAATRDLPPLYWGAPTRMACMAQAVSDTRRNAYAHHIQRLMVTGNFATLAGIDPAQVHEWYLAVYADAFEWVEAPNTLGMALHADGGQMASKPYVASGAYISKMSDYCKSCAYNVQEKTGPAACPLNYLYWDFIDRHQARFRSNPRMAQIVAAWGKRPEADRARVRADAAQFLGRLDAGDPL